MSAGGTTVELVELTVAADPDRWRGAGFEVDGDGGCRLGSVRVVLGVARAGPGIVGLTLAGLPSQSGQMPDLDGLPVTPGGARTTQSETPATQRAARVTPSSAPATPARHPNGAVRIDHVVALTPDLERTVDALESAGLDLRRIRDEGLPGGGTRQAFFSLGEVILEVIEQPAPDGAPADPGLPARLWGLALLTEDLDATAARLGSLLGAVRDAIQPARRIATVRRYAGLGTAVAFITPRPGD